MTTNYADSSSSVFLVSITGQIVGVTYNGLSAGSETDTDLYCKHCFVAGSDWSITAGQEEGITQVSKSKCIQNGSVRHVDY